MTKQKSNQTIPALLVGQGIPNFEEISPDHVEEHMPSLLKDINLSFNNLESNLQAKIIGNQSLTWEEVMEPIYKIGERLRWSWSAISHLNSVCNSTKLREVYEKQQPEIIRLSNRFGQNKTIYEAILHLKNKQQSKLDDCQMRIIDSELLSMKQRGVGLESSELDSFNSNSERLAELSTKFSNNILDATKQWNLLLTESSETDGLPFRTLQSLAFAAKEAGDINKTTNKEPTPEEGPWRLSLDMPCYISVITYATNRKLRETIYKAFVGRASQGQLNNKPLIEEILILREKQAKILGYKNWAEISLESKMADNISDVETLLEELRLASLPAAERELHCLQIFAEKNQTTNQSKLAPWDISFWSEKLKQEKFDLNQELLRPWFPLPNVLKGLFNLCERLFDIHIETADGEAPIWNKDVRFFKIKDKKGNNIASFFLDPYSRPENKRGGAWMDECLARNISSNGDITLPIAYLICNQTPPVENIPSLMSFDEVKTLFHEFGHGLQHMLTTVDYPQAAGINNIEWDAVELPSQFMENWCLDRNTLMGLAKHWETGETLSEKDFQKLILSNKFNSGLATLRQVHFALTDIRLHSQWNNDVGKTPDQLRREIAINTTVIPPIPEDNFLCGFSHIFAGGYAAGYYSYKWSEVLSADAFAAFEEVGLENELKVKETGKQFKDTILSLGGSRAPKETYKLFRGRDATTDALIKHSGL